jgi:hypothetical protein
MNEKWTNRWHRQIAGETLEAVMRPILTYVNTSLWSLRQAGRDDEGTRCLLEERLRPHTRSWRKMNDPFLCTASTICPEGGGREARWRANLVSKRNPSG